MAYDALGRLTCRYTGSPCAPTLPAGAEELTYDAAGNLLKARNTTATTDLTYDDDGRLATLAQAGATTTYSYVENSVQKARLQKVTNVSGSTNLQTTLNYDPNGMLSTV